MADQRHPPHRLAGRLHGQHRGAALGPQDALGIGRALLDHRHAVDGQDAVVRLQAAMQRRGVGEDGEDGDAVFGRHGHHQEPDADEVAPAGQPRLVLGHLAGGLKVRVLVAELADELLHLGVEGFGVEAALDPGAVAGDDARPVAPVEVGVDVEVADGVDESLKNPQLLRGGERSVGLGSDVGAARRRIGGQRPALAARRDVEAGAGVA